ncbi:hypothetical protein [Sphaerotilus montanus]|uniref:hypothetical protein n=1 Tax=Sphaerotilus montanus TaxID=522889 RepID=UPI003FA31EA5
MTDFDDDYDPSLYWFPVEGIQRKVRVHLRLQYKSTASKVTERDYDVESFERGDGAYMMHGFCRLRNARRSLSTKAAQVVIDRETRKPITDLAAYLEEQYKSTPDYRYDLLLDTHGWAIGLLLYFAAADGAVREPERKIILEFILRLEGFGDLNSAKLDNLIRDAYRPSKTDFHRMVRHHSGDAPTYLCQILRDSARIIATNKKPHSEQIRAAVYINRQWKHVDTA